MRHSRTSMAGLAAVALLLAACSSSGGSLPPLVTPAPTPAPSAAVAAPSAAVAAPSAAVVAPSAAVAAPPAPTSFTATRQSGSVPCPSADPNGDNCSQTDLAWQAGADPGTGFRIYWTGTGEGPDATCLTEQASATVKLETKPAARTAQIFDPIAIGGGQICYWITAVNSSGESAQVPAAGN